MKNYVTLGPVRIKVSNRHLASWGFECFGIGGLSFLSRTNSGDLVLASYHPQSSDTWHWSFSISKRSSVRPWIDRSRKRCGQWHDYYWLPFGREIIVSQQDYHKCQYQ
jgi:hypothetical protein